MENTEILRLSSEILEISEKPNVPLKLPPIIEGMNKEGIQILLTDLYRKVVVNRGNVFESIAGKEMAENIEQTAQWMLGPWVKTSLLLQGTVGSGKTSLMDALYNLYHKSFSRIYKCDALFVFKQYKAMLNKEPSMYEELKKANYLFLNDLGIEPAQCRDYSEDYTPVPELIYDRYERQRQTVISTNLSDQQLVERYGKRILDRFKEMCEKIVFTGPSYRKW